MYKELVCLSIFHWRPEHRGEKPAEAETIANQVQGVFLQNTALNAVYTQLECKGWYEIVATAMVGCQALTEDTVVAVDTAIERGWNRRGGGMMVNDIHRTEQYSRRLLPGDLITTFDRYRPIHSARYLITDTFDFLHLVNMQEGAVGLEAKSDFSLQQFG